MNFIEKHLITSALVVFILFTALFILGETSFKTTFTEVIQYIPSQQTQTAAVSDFNGNLILHYTFDDGTATDVSGKGNSGTLGGGLTPVSGVIGQALSFNGSNGYISIPTNLLGTGDVTVSAWIYPTNLGANANYYYILSDGHFYIGVATSYSGNNLFASNDGSGAVNSPWGSIVAGTWQLITVVRKSDGTFTLYVDGVVRGGVDRSGGGSIKAGSAMNIGRRYSPAYYWNGSLDDIRIYDRALSSAEIQSLHALKDSGGTEVTVSPDTGVPGSSTPVITTPTEPIDETPAQPGPPSISLPSQLIPPERRIDWSGAGISGGIPRRETICATVTDAPYNAKGDGTTNDTLAIQTALNACAGSNAVVYVPPGTYRVTRLQMNSGESLRGAGPSRTTILGSTAWSPSIISMEGNRHNLWYYADFLDPATVNKRTYAAVVSGATKGSRSITLDANPGISVGDFLLLTQTNDGHIVDPTTSQGWIYGCTINRGDTSGSVTAQRCLGQILRVSSVSGTTVGLEDPLNWTYQSSLKPMVAVSKGTNWLAGAGIEHLKVRQPAEMADQYHIQVGGAAYSWIQGVEIQDITMRGIEMLSTYHVVVADAYLHDGPVNNQKNCGRNRAYGISLDGFATGNLVYNTIIKNLDGGGITTNNGSNGNVLAYNSLSSPCSYDSRYNFGGPSMNHGSFPYMNLWEGNNATRQIADVLQGSSAYNTVFRTHSAGWTNTENGNQTPIYNNGAVILEARQRYYNIVASVLGTSGFSNVYQVGSGVSWKQPGDNPIFALGTASGGTVTDSSPSVLSSLYRLANYDVVHACVWHDADSACLNSDQISSLKIPPSLYLPGRPTWWPASIPFPPIGPDVHGGNADSAGHAYKIPAQVCAERGEMPDCLRGRSSEDIPSVTLPITPPTTPKTADFNSDGRVNSLDFSALQSKWNQPSTIHDLNKDGIVNTLDYSLLIQQWTG